MNMEESSKFIGHLQRATGSELSLHLMDLALFAEREAATSSASGFLPVVIEELALAIEQRRWGEEHLAEAFFVLSKCRSEKIAVKTQQLAARIAPAVHNAHLARQIMIALENFADSGMKIDGRYAKSVSSTLRRKSDVWDADPSLKSRVAAKLSLWSE